MVLTGELEFDETAWVASVESVGAFCDGETIDEALEVIGNVIRIRATRDGRALDGFKTFITAIDRDDGKKTIEVRSNQPTRLAFVMLRHQREFRGMSHADVANKLGARSRNTYARYEQGTSVPTVDKFVEILTALLPDFGLRLEQNPKRKRARKAA